MRDVLRELENVDLDIDRLERSAEVEEILRKEIAVRRAMVAGLERDPRFRALLAEIHYLVSPNDPATIISREGQDWVDRDPNGRLSAFRDGMRHVYLEILKLTETPRDGRPVVTFEERDHEPAEPAQ